MQRRKKLLTECNGDAPRPGRVTADGIAVLSRDEKGGRKVRPSTDRQVASSFAREVGDEAAQNLAALVR